MKPGTLIWESPIQFRQGLTVLADGAHPDDIELGASATIMKLLDEYDAKVFYRVFSYGTPSWKIKASLQYPTYPEMGDTVPQDRGVEAFKAAVRMGLPLEGPGGFTPNLFVNVSGETIWARQLMHQDDKKDLKKYGEIITEKSLGDATIYLKKGSYAERKVDLIRECFRTQYIPGRFYMVPDRILGIMHANAIHCGYAVEYAEGFEGRISM